jgi:hypothetical protein
MVVTLSVTLCACAGAQASAHAAQLRANLRNAMQKPITSRASRDEQSRLLANTVKEDALDGLDREKVRAAFGPGQSCRLDVCSEQGFTAHDWYYEIGVIANESVKQLPLLLIAFDPHERVSRVFTLTTH